MLEKINQRLNGRKVKQMSFIGCVVLAQATLSSIPYYTMQSTMLPGGLCDIIDKKKSEVLFGEDRRRSVIAAWYNGIMLPNQKMKETLALGVLEL